MSASQEHDVPTHCENCQTPLEGHYCHACGQSVVNPVRHAGHALEEVFEAFWHLDGRIFRTLRDLLHPGRVAANYLAGQRTRYVAPLRLFVVVSVLAFFVGHLAVRTETDEKPVVGDTITVGNTTVRLGEESDRLAQATTVEEVEQIRQQTLKELNQARAAVAAVPQGRKGIDTAIDVINKKADKRVAQLKEQGPQLDPAAEAAAASAGPAESAAPDKAAPATGEPAAKTAPAAPAPIAVTPTIEFASTLSEVERLRDEKIAPIRQRLAALPADSTAARNREILAIREINHAAGCRAAQLEIRHAEASEGLVKRRAGDDVVQYGDTDCGTFSLINPGPWDPDINPLVIESAPKFFNRWLNEQIGKGRGNIQRMERDPKLYVHAFLSAVPSALFLLVPVFALLLKLAYLGSGRLYLEHLVVALYSHAFLCLSLLVIFIITALNHVIAPHWSGFNWVTGWSTGLLIAWMPIYLLLMQKRVYGNGWLVTALRFTLIGWFYFFLLGFAVSVMALVNLVRM